MTVNHEDYNYLYLHTIKQDKLLKHTYEPDRGAIPKSQLQRLRNILSSDKSSLKCKYNGGPNAVNDF